MNKILKDEISNTMVAYNERSDARMKAFCDAWGVVAEAVRVLEKEKVSLEYLYHFQKAVSVDIMSIYDKLRDFENENKKPETPNAPQH